MIKAALAIRTYAVTTSLCSHCARESPGRYEEYSDGMWLTVDCADCGSSKEKVENDAAFFKWGYEQEYVSGSNHLVLPITYRCNLRCKYCYTLSNSLTGIPRDRSYDELAKIVDGWRGNITLIGGEPTLRDDLMELIRLGKTRRRRKISLGTNGQKLRDPGYVGSLKEAGLDFVFLSLNAPAYEISATVRQNKLKALQNCRDLSLPVWLHQTIDDLPQLDSIHEVLEAYRRVVFSFTIRAVKPFGLNLPEKEIFVSDILRYLGEEGDYRKGFNFFNREITLHGISTKICSWVNDAARCGPIDSRYLISDGTVTAFHLGMKIDEVLLKKGLDGEPS